MKKTFLTLLITCTTLFTYGQVAEYPKMIELAKAYKNFMFTNEPGKETFKEISAGVPENLKTATEFILQTITTDNKLLTETYLTRPEDKVLRQIYIILSINSNLRSENQVDNNKLIDSLTAKEFPAYKLFSNYYSMLFTAVGNKNQPFDLSKTDLKLNNYNLKDDTEKGIFFLTAISACGSVIWGYMNIVKPANTKKAYKHIKDFPKVNGQPYYQFTDFYFPDFEIMVDEKPQSYKSFYLDKYYQVLLSHLICLNKEGGSEKEKNDLLLGSIMKDEKLYKYTKYKETLESILQKQKIE